MQIPTISTRKSLSEHRQGRLDQSMVGNAFCGKADSATFCSYFLVALVNLQSEEITPPRTKLKRDPSKLNVTHLTTWKIFANFAGSTGNRFLH